MPHTVPPTVPLSTSTIVLNRGETGLGFNIRGGIDNPHIPGDTGIFVTKIRETGAAFVHGKLKEGDKILEINGNNLVGVTHEDAVHYFTKAKDTVTLKVLHGAQAQLLRQREEERVIKKAKKERDALKKGSKTKYYIALGVAAVVVIGVVVYKFSPEIKKSLAQLNLAPGTSVEKVEQRVQ